MTTTYRITHRSEYAYERDVSASYGQLHMLPRDLATQRCRSARVEIEPAAGDYRERRDFFGNRVSFLAIHEPHRALCVTATSVVEVEDPRPPQSLLGQRSWEEARDAGLDRALPDALDAVQFRLDSPLVEVSDDYRAYALESFTPGRGLVEAVACLSARIHADFTYAPGATSVTTPLAEAFARREGVCQDFAHLGIACLRALGLPARYVSGYIETDPPPGRPKLTGVDGSHAWLAVLVPEVGWLDVDPTNGQFAGARHIVTAYGRDYGDVPPMNGVIYTEGRTLGLNVSVDVVAL